jgi:hypothetical protein
MVPLRFNFVDILRAPRLALSPKKIWIMWRALALALILYNAGAYLGYALSGGDVYGLWRVYYLFPPATLLFGGYGALGYALWGVGAAAFFISNDFFSRKEAGKFVARHWRAALGTPVAILVVLALLVGAGLLIGLIGKIPWFGDVVAAASFLPMWLGGIFFLFLALVFVLSLLLTPAIVGTTGDDTFEASFELFSTLSGQPWRLVVYEAFLGTLTAAATLLFAAFAFGAVKAAYWALALPMGAKAGVAFDAAWRVMPSWFRGAYPGTCPPLEWISGCCPGCMAFGAGDVVLPLPWPVALAATLLSLGLLAVLGVVVAYKLSCLATGQTLIYIVIRKKKDDENLLEMFDDELEQAMLEAETAEETPPAEASGA